MEREELAKLLDANASTEDLLKASQNFGRAVGFQQEYKEGISKRTGQVVKCVKLTAANRQKKKYTIEQHDEAYNNQK